MAKRKLKNPRFYIHGRDDGRKPACYTCATEENLIHFDGVDYYGEIMPPGWHYYCCEKCNDYVMASHIKANRGLESA